MSEINKKLITRLQKKLTCLSILLSKRQAFSYLPWPAAWSKSPKRDLMSAKFADVAKTATDKQSSLATPLARRIKVEVVEISSSSSESEEQTAAEEVASNKKRTPHGLKWQNCPPRCADSWPPLARFTPGCIRLRVQLWQSPLPPMPRPRKECYVSILDISRILCLFVCLFFRLDIHCLPSLSGFLGHTKNKYGWSKSLTPNAFADQRLVEKYLNILQASLLQF